MPFLMGHMGHDGVMAGNQCVMRWGHLYAYLCVTERYLARYLLGDPGAYLSNI